MSNATEVANLARTFVVMNSQFSADSVPVSDSIYAELDQKYDGFAGHLLIACHHFTEDWPSWEVHPNGDEIVCLLSGDAEMLLHTRGGDVTKRMSTAGDFLVVPKGTWHTARVHAPTSMLFVTPGEGTENRETPAG